MPWERREKLPYPPMTVEELEEISRRLFGVRWRGKLGAVIGHTTTTIWKWTSGRRIPRHTAITLRCLDATFADRRLWHQVTARLNRTTLTEPEPPP